MVLNKSHGNMYPWVTHTWNPIKGCKHACRYCYVKELETRYQYNTSPRFVEGELKTNLGKGNVIFVGSASDMWGEWVSSDSIERVLDRCREFDNTYVFQTKNPARFLEFVGRFPKKSIFGTTIEADRYIEQVSEAPDIPCRVEAMKRIEGNKFVSIEPILKFDLERLVRMIFQIQPSFVTIGADSKNHNLLEPNGEQVRQLLKRLGKFTEVRPKTNLRRLLKRTLQI
jgi:DNA repair photolyase